MALNWYRVTFVQAGRTLRPVELAAHSGEDAVFCGAVKAGLMCPETQERGDVRVADIECIEDPEHAKEAQRIRQLGIQGFVELSDRLPDLANGQDGEAAKEGGES